MRILFILLSLFFSGWTTTAAVIVSLGPDFNSGFFVAPGAVVTVRVADLPVAAEGVAGSAPLPRDDYGCGLGTHAFSRGRVEMGVE